MKLPDPDRCAQQILERARLSNPPVNLSQIVLLWNGLNISEDSLDKEGYFIDLGEQGGEIIVRGNDPPYRKSFTVAHEIGHWILSREYNIPPDFIRNHSYRTLFERWCDRFAAALLMPKDWLLADLRQAKISGLLKEVLKLPNIYNVSPQAFRLRLTEISPISLYVAAMEKGRISIEESYETKEVSRLLLAKALYNIKNRLLDKRMKDRFLDPDSDLFCLYHTILNDLKLQKWIICIFPSVLKGKADLTTASAPAS